MCCLRVSTFAKCLLSVVIPVGFFIDKDNYYQIDPTSSPFVIEAFKRYADGEKIVAIVKWLNDCGVQTYKKKPMGFDSVGRMLRNRSYIGEYHYDTFITPGGVPAIVPNDLFEKVQERLDKNKKAPARHKAEDDYLLTTKLFCGLCGAFMVGESGTSRSMNVHHYYKCVAAKKHRACKKKSVKKAWIEDIVVNQAARLLEDDSLLERIADNILELQKRENITLPMLRKQLAETERGIENMLNAIQQGVLNSSTKKRLDDLEAAKGDLEVKILQEEIEQPLLTKEQILFWFHKFRGIDISKREQRQLLIDTFVNSVYLYDDRIVLTFNNKEGAKSITIADIDRSFGGSDLTVGVVPNDEIFV